MGSGLVPRRSEDDYIHQNEESFCRSASKPVVNKNSSPPDIRGPEGC